MHVWMYVYIYVKETEFDFFKEKELSLVWTLAQAMPEFCHTWGIKTVMGCFAGARTCQY